MNLLKCCPKFVQFASLRQNISPRRHLIAPSQPRYISGQTDRNIAYPGTYPGWKILEERKISEFDIEAVLLEHLKTKAVYLHMGCEDENNAFSVNFRTTPGDSTGVAHILEHTTLCGSEKYPVRDPFMKMLNRSLSTFMNAMTGPDYTLYPFSTCNKQDYYNLMSVYLDSVFQPLLREEDFLQEGWRLEHDEIEDTSSPLVIKGVVFNEMKGAYANAQSLFGQQLLNNLYPSHTYSHSSGGYPLAIPDLTWEQLKQFHSSHYHPSNARFLSYGSLPLGPTLAKLDQEYLENFSAQEHDTEVPLEHRWDQPRRVDTVCPPDPMSPDPSRQSTVAVSFLLTDIRDIQLSFALQVVGELLMGGPASPFYKSLIEPGLGSNFSPVSGYEDHTKETNFTIGLQNIDISEAESILKIIDDTIDKVVEEGFDDEKIEAILHSFELSLKNKSSNFGLNLIMSMTPFWNHAENPLDFMEVNKYVSWFRQKLAEEPNFLQELVRVHLKENKHKLVQTMSPVEDYQEKEQQQFDQLEELKRSGLTQEQKDDINLKCLKLQKMQDEKDDASCLPSLSVSDISNEYLGTSLINTDLSGVPIQISVQPTNEVSYFRALVDTSSVPADLKPYLPVFTSVLTKMGAGDMNYADLDTAVELSTGGLAASMHVQEGQHDFNTHTEAVLLSSHCLERNTERMFSLWSEIFNSVKWNDSGRLATLLKMQASQAVTGLPQSGHRYAMTSANSSLNHAASLVETFTGMTHINLLSKLAKEDVFSVTKKLQTIAGLLLNKNRMKIALNSSDSERLLQGTESFLSGVSGPGESLSTNWEVQSNVTGKSGAKSVQQHYVTPFPINFTSLAVPTVPYSHQDFAALRVLAALLSSKYLHLEIREKGGAYGGGAMAGSGAFTFYSYRDPKNLETFSVYRRSGEWALEDNFNQTDVDEAILRVFQKLDEPIAPGYRGLRFFLSGITDNDFSQHRLRIKQVKTGDLKEVAEKYLFNNNKDGKTMIGGQQPGLEDLGWTIHRQ